MVDDLSGKNCVFCKKNKRNFTKLLDNRKE